jgi:RNA polymerase sigma factor (sigma-70 family)
LILPIPALTNLKTKNMTAIEFSHQLINLEDRLSRFAFRLTSNKEDAKDLLQETMLKAYSYRHQFEDYTNLQAWTSTIMRNTFINNYRRSVRQRTSFDNTEGLFFLSQNKEVSNVTPDSVYSAEELSQLIDNLRDEFKTPFKMHIEGYKYNEIAEALNLKIGTVKSRIYFARQKLMGALKKLN